MFQQNRVIVGLWHIHTSSFLPLLKNTTPELPSLTINTPSPDRELLCGCTSFYSDTGYCSSPFPLSYISPLPSITDRYNSNTPLQALASQKRKTPKSGPRARDATSWGNCSARSPGRCRRSGVELAQPPPPRCSRPGNAPCAARRPGRACCPQRRGIDSFPCAAGPGAR